MNNYYCDRNFILRLLLFFTFVLFISYQANAGLFGKSKSNISDDPIGGRICAIVATISGNTAKGISIIAIIAVGVGLFMGKVNWGVALTTASGVVIIFGAPKIIGWIGGIDEGDVNECFSNDFGSIQDGGNGNGNGNGGNTDTDS